MKLTMELDWVKGSLRPKWHGHWCWKLDVSPIDIAYSSSYEDYDNKVRGVRWRRHTRYDLSDLKIEALKFDDNLNPENYLHWVQAIKRTIELNQYYDEKILLSWSSLRRKHMPLFVMNVWRRIEQKRVSPRSRLALIAKNTWIRGSYLYTSKNST